MSPDILIVRDDNGYRLLHGHLHLANALKKSKETIVEIKDEGKVKIIKTAEGLMVALGGQSMPLFRY